LYNSAYRYVLHQARDNQDLSGLEAVVHSIDNLVTRELDERLLPIVLEALLLRAQMHALLGNQTSSRSDIAKALHLAEPENFVSVFIEQGPQLAKSLADLIDHNQLDGVGLEYAERILEVLSTPPSPGPHQSAPQEPPTPLVEALTERELDVLRLMADGLKYKEIADRLYISMNTVRSHTKAIYAKLNVSNRTKAVLEARRLRIL
jgi:LuxR family maltose regulon positive regulatory protein